MNIGVVDDAGTWADVAVTHGPFLVGWTIGWLLLWQHRPLPATGADRDGEPVDAARRRCRPAVAVVIPARDEAAALPHLLPGLLSGAAPGDEIVVVDDHSSDGSGDVARSLGARVVVPAEVPEGWLGKPNACWHGANVTTAPVLAFVDADVRPPEDLIDRLGAAVADHPGRVVSVQPWHVVERPSEHLSLLCNVTALMGVGRFAAWGAAVRPRAAFGPVLALDRSTYDAVGGHSNPEVRSRHTEDIGMARAVGGAELYTGRPDITFRMYPGGLADLVRGWTRSIATGARSVPWWAVLGTVAWIWSLAAGWLVAWWWYPASAVQVWVLGRRAGRFSPVVAALYPVAVAVFVVVFLRSLVAVVFRRDVSWKSRRVAAR